jgi:hypothetical protein
VQWCVDWEEGGLCAVMMDARTGLNSSSVMTPWVKNDWSTTRCTWLYASSSGKSRTSGVSSRDILVVLCDGLKLELEVTRCAGTFGRRGYAPARARLNAN